MGLQIIPAYIGQTGYNHPVELFRNILSGIAHHRTGMVRPNDFDIVLNPAAMNVNILIGEAIIQGLESNTQGAYFVWADGSEVVAFPASGGTARIDSLILRVIDTQYGTDAASPSAFWEVVSGTPSGSPVALADADFLGGGSKYRPGGWWRIADFLIPAGITNMSAASLYHHRQSTSVGGIMACNSNAFPTSHQRGEIVSSRSAPDDGVAYVSNGIDFYQISEPDWQDYTPTVYTNIVTGATVSATVVYCRYRRIAGSVEYQGWVTINASTSGGLGVSLPVEASYRQYDSGSMILTGASAPTNQAGIAAMNQSTAPFNRFGPVSLTNAFINSPASAHVLHWNARYECATIR